MTRRLVTLIALAFVALLATLAAQEPATMTTLSGGQWSGELTCWGSATGGGCGKWDSVNTPLSVPAKLYVPGRSKAYLKEVVLGEGWECWKAEAGWKCGDPADAPSVRLGQVRSWDATAPICNCLSSKDCCSMSSPSLSQASQLAGPLPDWEGDTSPVGQMRSITITPGPTTVAAPGLKVYTTFLGLPCGDAFPMPGCLPPEMQGWLVQIEGGDQPFFDVTLVYEDAEGRRHVHTQERVPRAEPFQGKPSFTAVPFRTGRAKSPPWFPVGTTVIRTEVWYSADGRP